MKTIRHVLELTLIGYSPTNIVMAINCQTRSNAMESSESEYLHPKKAQLAYLHINTTVQYTQVQVNPVIFSFFMAQYAHFSDPDPEWLVAASSVPTFYVEDIVDFRKKFISFWEEANSQLVADADALECGLLINRNLSSYCQCSSSEGGQCNCHEH